MENVSRHFRPSPSVVDFRSVSGVNRLASQNFEIRPKIETSIKKFATDQINEQPSSNTINQMGYFRLEARQLAQNTGGVSGQMVKSVNVTAPPGQAQSLAHLPSPKLLSWSTIVNPQVIQHPSGTVFPTFRPDLQSINSPHSRIALGASVSSIPQTVENDEVVTATEWIRVKQENVELKSRIKQMEEDQNFILELNQLLIVKLDTLIQSHHEQPQNSSIHNRVPINGQQYSQFQTHSMMYMNGR